MKSAKADMINRTVQIRLFVSILYNENAKI